MRGVGSDEEGPHEMPWYSRSWFRVISTTATIMVAGVLFAASLEALRWNDDNSQLQQHPGWVYAKEAQSALGPYSVANSYGLFRRMTGQAGRQTLSRIPCEMMRGQQAWEVAQS